MELTLTYSLLSPLACGGTILKPSPSSAPTTEVKLA